MFLELKTEIRVLAVPHAKLHHDEWLNLMHAEGEIKASEQFLTVM